MFEALFANLPIPRRILQLKAKLTADNFVHWYDLGAPLDLPDQARLSWEKGKALVRDAFNRCYPDLGNFFQTVVDKKWIDWEPRAGKRPGGFCTGSMLTNESRIFMTYNEALGDVLTLAHETGHAFHGHLMRELRPYGRIYPMTLAETASTFGEQVLTNGLLEDSSIADADRAMMLDIEVGHGAIYLLDIPVRFEFEKLFYQERQHGELTVSRLKELMVETQRVLFGDVLARGGEDPYFWASNIPDANNDGVVAIQERYAYALQQGVAEAEAIDTIAKLGFNHPIGPLALADLIGLDVCLAILEVLHRDLGDDKYRPCPLLRRMVAAGRLGRKSGRGFHDYRG